MRKGASDATCVIDFGFDISRRYFQASVAGGSDLSALGVACDKVSGSANKLKCLRFDAAGTSKNGGIMVTIY